MLGAYLVSRRWVTALSFAFVELVIMIASKIHLTNAQERDTKLFKIPLLIIF